MVEILVPYFTAKLVVIEVVGAEVTILANFLNGWILNRYSLGINCMLRPHQVVRLIFWHGQLTHVIQGCIVEEETTIVDKFE